MIGLLARRTLTDRPRRSLLLLGGFGISVAVMIVLLSIGEAILEQARDKDLVGGDLVVLPEGIDVEVMKIGGATGMWFAIDNARFVFRQVLSGPRYAPYLASVAAPVWQGEPTSPPLAAASPLLGGKVVYVRKLTQGVADPVPRRALAHGVIPSLDRAVVGAPLDGRGAPLDWNDTHADRMWMDPPVDSLYNDIDRFHLPPAIQRDLDRWAEWLYFNFTDAASGAYGFLSLIAAGEIAAGRGRAVPMLQIVWPGKPPARFAGDLPLAPDGISTERVALEFGPRTTARFEAGVYRLNLDWPSPNGPVRGELVVEPVRDLDFPPFVIHESERFVSGYVVPAIRARMSGWIEAGGRRLELDGVPAYHDHNWGTWRDVHWDWGTAGDFDYGLFYGRVEHPELRPGRAGAGVFCLLSQARRANTRGGFLGLFRPDSISYTWRAAPRDLPGSPIRVPRTVSFAARLEGNGESPPSGATEGGDGLVGADSIAGAEASGVAAGTWKDAGDRIEVRIVVDDVLASPPNPGEKLVFLQARGTYSIRARIASRVIAFAAPGFAEVFVPSRAEPRSSGR